MRNIVVIVGIIVLVLILIPQIMRQVMYKKIMNDLSNKNYDAAQKKLDGFWCMFTFSPYNREFLRLNAFMMQGDREKIEAQFDNMFDQLRMNKKQTYVLAQRAFYTYLETGEHEKAAVMLEKCKASGKEGSTKNMQLMYDVMVDHKSNHIEEVQTRLETLQQKEDAYSKEANRVRIGIYEYLIGLQYLNQQNKKMSRTYFEKARTHCKNSPYEALVLKGLNSL